MDENYKPYIYAAQKTSHTRNMEKTTSRHIIIKFLKSSDKENTVSVAGRKKRYVMQKNNNTNKKQQRKRNDNSRFIVRNNAEEDQHL